MGNSQSSPLVDCLKAAVGGDGGLVATSANPLYQLVDVKPYNLDVAVHPVAVTYPKTADQVASIIGCASQYNYKVQPKGGGHSYGNYGLGGGDTNTITVDLKNFQQFSMDTNTWEAKIGGGTRLGDVTKKLLDAGDRAIAHGTCPDVGIGGHATMGGLGPASRMWGSAMDHVVAVQVALANATVVTASATEYPDIFWAMKGAGSSFGIVTEFTVATHPAPGESVSYSYTFSGRPYKNLAQRFKAWQTLVSDPNLSKKFASQVQMSELGMMISGTFFGSQEEFESLNMESVFPDSTNANVAVLNGWAGTVSHWVEDVALELTSAIPAAFYSKSLAFTADDLIPDAGIDDFFQYLDDVDKGTLIWFAIFDLEGGAINDIAPDATAYGHRDTLFYLQTYAIGLTGVSGTTRSFVTGMSDILTSALPGKTLGSYAGYVDPALQNPQQAYFGSNLAKLESLKSVIDPADIFHNPQSIRPASS